MWSKPKIFLTASALFPQGQKLKFLYLVPIGPKKLKKLHISQTTFYFCSNHLMIFLNIFLFYLENLKFFFHLLIYLSNTKAIILKSFQINNKKLKYRNLTFLDKRKILPRALLFLMELGELYFLKT